VIHRVVIKNFRCIREATIDLGPLTILVGPNASGKSTVLEALAPRQALGLADVWMKQPGTNIDIELKYGETIGIRSFGKGVDTNRIAHTYHLLRLDVGLMRNQNTLARVEGLSTTGDNLANVFGSFTRKQQASLAEELCRLVPVFSDVEVTPTSGGQHVLRFQDRWKPSVWYVPSEVSDGTMLMLAFLALQYQPVRPDLIVVEEPDRGLHPYLVNQLIALLRKVSAGEIGVHQPMQVVVATHSAELLDYARPEEVRFLNRNRETGALEVHTIDPQSPDWRATYEEYRESLGSVWLSGGLGGVPGA
jgi:predicted ATPase